MSTPTTHTPEPWFIAKTEPAEIRTHPSGGVVIGETIPNAYNASRAVACVNACAGMADPAKEIAILRDYAGRTHELATQVCVVVNQREAKQEKIDDILSVIPADAPCQHDETGETVADYILGLQKEVATLREERDLARERGFESADVIERLERERDSLRGERDCLNRELSDICRVADAHTADEACEVIRAMREAIREAHENIKPIC